MTDELNFSSKIALVTGSSRGIGEATIRALAARGAECVVNYVDDPHGRNKADAERIAAEIKAPLIVQANIADAQQVTAMMSKIRDSLGGLDILINNAGILRDHSIKKMPLADFQAVLDVNLTGTFNCIQQAQPILREGGRVVSLSSVSAAMGFFGQSNYAPSKAGVMALTKVAARELAKQKITVNAVAPGFIETEMTRDMPEEVVKQTLSQIPLGRWGKTEDVVGVILFLCSPLAQYITGQTIHVNGGFYMG
ncbi:MAG TPA: 3-oxoacyl-ACP reductase family protein [Tepidisphaeraceae bacterium]|jgi:3-oxoacyl-[acyl-carrier protein] reductase|nr:3-oxoacyl-ACP reductase family protein [Tepidisphaeraceae bacterium]